MKVSALITALRKELSNSIEKGWLSASDFSSHESTKRSILHAKMLGLLSYVLQNRFGYYVQLEPRPWGQFKPDILAFSWSKQKRRCEALIEYESPNSYLDLRNSHVGKDLKHYFEFHQEGNKDWLVYLKYNKPRDWLIITSLPTKAIHISNWNWIPTNWTKEEKRGFARNPAKFMYRRYRNRLNNLFRNRRLKIKEIPLRFYNIAQIGNSNRIAIKRIISS